MRSNWPGEMIFGTRSSQGDRQSRRIRYGLTMPVLRTTLGRRYLSILNLNRESELFLRFLLASFQNGQIQAKP